MKWLSWIHIYSENEICRQLCTNMYIFGKISVNISIHVLHNEQDTSTETNLWKCQLISLCHYPFCDCKGQNQSKFWYTVVHVSSALKSRTLSNLACSKYIYMLKWVDRFWLVKALSGIVQGGQNDSKKKTVKNAPVCTFVSTVKTVSWLIFTSIATCH